MKWWSVHIFLFKMVLLGHISNVKKKIEKKRNLKWRRETNRGRVTKIFFPLIEQHRKERLTRIKRKHLQVLLKCLTGHVELNKQEARLNHIASPMCQCMEEEESADHYLSKRPRYALYRYRWLGSPFIDNYGAGFLRIRRYSWVHKRNKGIEDLKVMPPNWIYLYLYITFF